MASGNHRRVEVSGDQASGRDTEGSSLLPMLTVGLDLIVIGAMVIMVFV